MYNSLYVPSLEERQQEDLASAEAHLTDDRCFEAARFLLEAAFLSNDEDAYQLYMRRGEILEDIGISPIKTYGAAFECADGLAAPAFADAVYALYKMAEAHKQRGRYEAAKSLLRDAQEAIFVFKTDYGWSDTEAIADITRAIDELYQGCTRQFLADDSEEEVTEIATGKSSLHEDTVRLDGIQIEVIPEPGIG